MIVQDEELDLGIIGTGETKTHTLKLVNTSDKSVFIERVKSNCSCTTVKDTRFEIGAKNNKPINCIIRPSEEDRLRAYTAGSDGVRISAVILPIIRGCTARPNLFRLTGTLVGSLQLSTTSLTFTCDDYVGKEGMRTKSIVVSTAAGTPTSTSFECEYDSSLLSVNTQSEADGRTRTIYVTPHGNNVSERIVQTKLIICPLDQAREGIDRIPIEVRIEHNHSLDIWPNAVSVGLMKVGVVYQKSFVIECSSGGEVVDDVQLTSSSREVGGLVKYETNRKENGEVGLTICVKAEREGQFRTIIPVRARRNEEISGLIELYGYAIKGSAVSFQESSVRLYK